MKVLAVVASDKIGALNRLVFETIVKDLEAKGVQVDVLDLYKRMEEIPFYVQTKPGNSITGKVLSDYPFFHENRDRFLAADALLIVFPTYWYTVPGILKSWLDLITNFAWEFLPGEWHPRPLHKITKAFVVNTIGMPWWYRFLFTRNSTHEQLKESFKFFGIKDYSFYEINSAEKLSQEQVERHLGKIIKKSRLHFNLN